MTRPKRRSAKPKKKLHPHGYYEKLLWLIVYDSANWKTKDELVTCYLKVWNAIWETTPPTGKRGRPRKDESVRLRKMLALMNSTGLGPYAAAKRVVKDDNVPAHLEDALIKKLVRAQDEKYDPKSTSLPEKGEKYNSINIPPDDFDLAVLQKDAKTAGKKQEKAAINEFLIAIEKLLNRA